MNSRWPTLVSLVLVFFTGLVITWQVLHYDTVKDFREWLARGRSGARPSEVSSSVIQSYSRAKQLAGISDIVKRDQIVVPAAGLCRYADLVLPPNARVFMKDMTGPTNWNKIMNYYYVTYYLFPREIGVSVDQPTRLAKDRFLGRTAESDQEALTNGYDVIVDFPPDGTLSLQLLRPVREFPIKEPITPAWFSSNSDTLVAFLLPLLTALSGMWLLRFLFSALNPPRPLPEQMAHGLGLGMMAVAAITLGVKLCGLHGRGLVFLLTAVGGIAEIWYNRNAYLSGTTSGFRKAVRHPVVLAILVAGLFVFAILFRLAGLQGLIDYDAVMAVSLKAKIIHLYTGSGIVQWFSNPRLAHAHTDYPTLLPSLQAATYDSLGHVDEFVTKFWPTWMLFFLLAALASLNRGRRNRFHASSFTLLGLLLLPVTQRYVQTEGGTMPMVFFSVSGFVQCALGLAGKDRDRLGLGLTLLFGAAMAKFEGFILLALVGSWLLLLPSARPLLKPSPRGGRVLGFCLLAALPFVCLRVQTPVLDYESHWAGYALHHPGATLLNCPGIFMILISQLFVSTDFACWSGEGGHLHWIGAWNGLPSLYNQSTLGLAWVCLFMSVALWFAVPTRRQVVVWMFAMLIGGLAAFSMVFSSFVSITSLTQVMGYTGDQAGRYFLPVLLAWFATMMTLFFADLPSSASTPGENAIIPDPTSSARSAAGEGASQPEPANKQSRP